MFIDLKVFEFQVIYQIESHKYFGAYFHNNKPRYSLLKKFKPRAYIVLTCLFYLTSDYFLNVCTTTFL